MTIRRLCRALLASAGAACLASCGGGGGSDLNLIPSPPLSPTPKPAPSPAPGPTSTPIIGSVNTSQEFARAGAEVDITSSSSGTLIFDDAAQPRIRYDASSHQYQLLLPSGANWSELQPSATTGPNSYQAGPAYVSFDQSASTGYSFSALARWTQGVSYGSLAIGIPTPAGAVPLTGSASFGGQLNGHSTEIVNDAWGPYPVTIGGKINLAFDFGAGTLSGSISPTYEIYDVRNLPTLDFTQTVYSTGSTTFSGSFSTPLSGPNAFSGQFTGPNAQELIGHFAFPYVSPTDGNVYQAAGALVGKR